MVDDASHFTANTPTRLNTRLEENTQESSEHPMRLDKFLKVTRLIKRRTIANALCDCGGVLLDGKIAKASSEVKAGQAITLLFGNRTITASVTGVPCTTQKIMPIDAMIANVVVTPRASQYITGPTPFG